MRKKCSNLLKTENGLFLLLILPNAAKKIKKYAIKYMRKSIKITLLQSKATQNAIYSQLSTV